MTSLQTAIIIPARYGSTRFAGKPLALLKGKTVLEYVVNIARTACEDLSNVSITVATDDERISNFCQENSIPFLMTPAECKTGTDRAMAAAHMLETTPDLVINLQGDAPFTPPDFVKAMIDEYSHHNGFDIVTPVVRLSWDELDQLRESKKTTPFSGTTAVLAPNNNALWFSKNILPALRHEDTLRQHDFLSPVYRHIGLYGYSRTSLEKYVTLPPSRYEDLEGLEQLRALENGMTIRCVVVDYKGRPAMTGIDSPEDLARAEALLK